MGMENEENKYFMKVSLWKINQSFIPRAFYSDFYFPGAMKARESPQGGDFFFKHVRNFKQVLTYNNR